MLELSVVEDFDYHSAEYRDLYEAADVTAFQHPAWQSAMQRHIRSIGKVQERSLVMRCQSTGRLLGHIPLIARRKLRATILEYANLGLVDYALPTLHADIWDWVPDPVSLSQQFRNVLGGYDMLRIKHMPTDDPLILRLFPNAYMERANFSAHAVELGPAPTIRPGASRPFPRPNANHATRSAAPCCATATGRCVC